jgi:4-amino-4-deoxy-L-arabinose transferase-like glycosyltransferase
MNSRNYGAFLITAIISVIIIFFNLDGIPLLDPDEPVYAETPKEMLLYDDFISPKIFGEYWYDKPPMYYWLVTLSYKIFGINDFAARFPSASLAVICILAMLYFGNKMFNKRTGMASALILVTSIEYFYLGKAAVTDITLNLFLTCSLFSFVTKKYYLFYFFAGLAVLTKGPIGLFFPGIIAIIYLIVTQNLQELKRMKIPFGIVIFSVIALPWYAIMYHLHGNAFIDTFLGFHNLTRFTSPEHPSGTFWYYYIPVLIIGFFPWNTLLFQSIYHSFTDYKKKFNELVFLNIWVIVVFIFFSVAQTKLVSYILPMYPPMAMLVGWYIDQLCNNYYNAKKQYSWSILLGILILGFIGGAILGVTQMPNLTHSVLFLNSTLLSMLVCIIFFTWKNQIEKLFWTNVLGMMIFSFVLVGMVFPAIAPQFSTFNTARQFEECYNGNSPIYISKFLHPGFSFYSNKYGIELIFSDNSIPDMKIILQENTQAYFILRDIDYERLPEETQNQLSTLKIIDNKMILIKK